MHDLRLPTLDETGAALDQELVRLAQAGDAASLGHVLARHRSEMTAVALAVLGRPAEAEDAVQDAMLVALSRIGDLRDARAVGPWLKAIVRNCCRMQLRIRTPTPVRDVPELPLFADRNDPAELLERRAAGDWVWHALERLSPTLRIVTVLRYFTDATTYEQIAAVCGIPVGTVRSRLSKARAKLSQELLAASTARHLDVSVLTDARRQVAEQTLSAGPRGEFGAVLRETWHPEVETVWADGSRTRGITPMVRVMDSGMDAGVRQRLAGVVASREIVIWDIDVLNPAADPAHCPPRTSWLLVLEHERVRRFHQFHAAPMSA